LAHAIAMKSPSTATKEVPLTDEEEEEMVSPQVQVLTNPKSSMEARKEAAEQIIKQVGGRWSHDWGH